MSGVRRQLLPCLNMGEAWGNKTTMVKNSASAFSLRRIYIISTTVSLLNCWPFQQQVITAGILRINPI